MKEALESGGGFLPSNAQAPEVLEPPNGAFHGPATAVASQATAVLGSVLWFAVGTVWRDHLHAHLRHAGIQLVAVIGLVANKAMRALWTDHEVEKSLHQRALVRTGRGAARRQREPVSIDHDHDL